MTMTKNAWSAIVAVLATLAVIVTLMFVPLNSAGSTPGTKVTICHATNSHTNPYTVNTVDSSSIDEENNQYLNGHGDHLGPVWYSGIADHSWGDIIPPFTNPETGNSFPGYNWTAEGQAIYNNGCEPVVPPTPVTPAVPGFADECGPDNEVVNVPDDGNGVDFTVTEDPAGTYTVTAVALDGFVIAEGAVSTWTFVANDAACPTETPSTPPVTPETPVVTPEVPVVTPEVPVTTPEVPVETPNEEETPEPDKDKDEPVRNTPPKDVQVIACVNGVWTITVNGEVISESGTCGETPENTVPQTFSETGL